MPGPLFSASRASRRLRWPPEPSPAASLGDVTAARIFLRAFFDSGVTNEFIKLVHVGVLRCAEPVARRRRQSWAPKVRERCGWAASWGAAAVHGSHRLFQRLHACRPWRPRHALPRGRSRERSTPILLGVALYRSTLRRRCLAGDPCLDAAARPSTARWLSASPRMRRDLSWRGKLQECFVLLAGEVQAIRVTAWLFATSRRGMRPR